MNGDIYLSSPGIYEKIRRLTPGEMQAAWTTLLQKGETVAISATDYLVQSNTKKILRLQRADGKVFSFKRYGGQFAAEGKEANLFRDAEGDLMVDLINEYNPFTPLLMCFVLLKWRFWL